MRACRRAGMSALGAAALLIAGYTATLAEDGVHRPALKISGNNPQKMNTVLNVAANVARHYSSKGEQAEIKIVAFNVGLHVLRSDASPVQKRVKSFGESMPNVRFHACNNII